MKNLRLCRRIFLLPARLPGVFFIFITPGIFIMSFSPDCFQHTPTLTVTDSRGLAVRTVAF
ncbi:hypothetical protein, partial [Enterobacter bugandensis]|uniref:hypothetical protein n=1 Tax=Enterobacter bugandensis TaxID=881260 RepID=UPI0021D0D4B5